MVWSAAEWPFTCLLQSELKDKLQSVYTGEKTKKENTAPFGINLISASKPSIIPGCPV
jgi:hypothetical protein